MAISDCPKCWETPCVCGYEYKCPNCELMKACLSFTWSAMVFGVLLAGLAYCVPAKAAEVKMPVTVKIVQCGPPDKLEEACAKDVRCCALIKDKDFELIKPRTAL